jgi:hypothetical protein
MSSSNLDKLVPTKYGWLVNFDKQFDAKWKPFGRPRFRQLVEYVPLFMRLVLRNEGEEYVFCFLIDIFVYGTD